MGDITMRQVILDARRHESIVIRVDGNSTCESAGSRVRSDRAPFAPRMMRRAPPLWFAATLAVTCLSDVPGSGGGAHAQSNGIAGNSLHLAQAKTRAAVNAAPAKQAPSADALARELATARRDIELLRLSTWAAHGTRGDATKARDLYAKAEAEWNQGGKGAIRGAAFAAFIEQERTR
ncbi:hypothetical protein H8A95_35005 [Bradyrhizobium sp. Pear76]|uniref:hypothetical protein n=1 Tax=Bradyrhizobium oropedii TaxID=1571201 RepID=UPI001E4253CB|nr:hypothetical protein [Bradyrhizobium oropedii]MCC8967397.1 hypothetical protein [Bradyrhizobium oropedii]